MSKSPPHTLTLDEFDDTVFEHLVASSIGQGSRKELVAVIFPDFAGSYYRITSNGTTVHKTSMLAEAIEAYNAQP